MGKYIPTIVVLFLSIAPLSALCGDLDNSGFETEFGSREDLNMWGELGESFGEAYPVRTQNSPIMPKAHDGERVLLINILQDSWSGTWQQLPWSANKTFTLRGYYQITGGDLEPDTSTFLKVEYYDGNDHQIGEETGMARRKDTHNKWVADVLRGIAPEGTESLRCVIIGGSNPKGSAITNRIFWDDVDLLE